MSSYPNPRYPIARVKALPNEAVVRQMCKDAQERRDVWANAFAQRLVVGVTGLHRQRAALAAREAAGGVYCGALDVLVRGEAAGMWTHVIGAGFALVAWPDSVTLLDTPVDAVRLMAAAGHHPAVLLLPAVIAKNTKE